MGEIRAQPPRVLLFFAATSRFDLLLDRLPDILREPFGPLALVSPRFDFRETCYYEPAMGKELRKQFFVCESLKHADCLPAIKVRANELEAKVASTGEFAVRRPLNLDPGYVDEAKLVLASTKDHAHRLYLGEGIYGEITLQYRDRDWRACPWTYPDYARDDFREFFREMRAMLRQSLAQ